MQCITIPVVARISERLKKRGKIKMFPHGSVFVKSLCVTYPKGLQTHREKSSSHRFNIKSYRKDIRFAEISCILRLKLITFIDIL
jgi:hypothetical protein